MNTKPSFPLSLTLIFAITYLTFLADYTDTPFGFITFFSFVGVFSFLIFEIIFLENTKNTNKKN